MALFIISVLFSFSAYRVKRYRKDPEPRSLREKYLMEDYKTVKRQVIDNFIVSFEYNKIKVEHKVRYINCSLTFLFVGLIVLILSIIMG